MTSPPDVQADGLADPQHQVRASEPDRPRPHGVPPAASWMEAEGEWRETQQDDAGLFHGRFRSWRADGSLKCMASYDHGKQVETGWRFHPDGSLFAVGQFVDGSPRGVHRRYASTLMNGERLQSCCVPTGAWQLRQTFASTGVVDRGWFNREGARLLDNGELYPERPPAVPPQAWFNEDARVWEVGVVFDQTGYTGTRRRWSVDGTLRSFEQLVRGKRQGTVRSYDDEGALAWEAVYDDDRLSGAFRALVFPAGHFVDTAVRRQEGWFKGDQAEGVWTMLDGDGVVCARRDLGLALDGETLPQSPVFVDVRRSAADWRALAGSLAAGRRLGEALLAAARAAASADDPAPFTELLEASTVRLGADTARAHADDILARTAEQSAPLQLTTMIDGLKRGGDAATLLWAIAKTLPGSDRASLDLVTAALLLAPDRTEPLSTRALLHESLGDLDAARADIARLSLGSPDQARLLELVTRVYFPRFDFWPERESLDLGPDEPALQPQRSPAEVREVIQRYATRLGKLKAALLTRVGESVPFMLPDLSALLPEGPLPLRQWTFTMSAEEYGGADQQDLKDVRPDTEALSTVEIAVDETQGLAPEVAGLLAVLRQARTDWSGLTWLCWAVGLEAPGLPEAIVPPAAFGRAAVMTMERSWRCRDKLNTSGLFALSKGIPGFDWEGTPIDLVPTTLAEVALEQYVETRAIFSWLCDPANRSPWQDDLRSAD